MRRRRLRGWLARVTSLESLRRAEYPRSSSYDGLWLVESDMGPHPLWLLEDLAHDLDLRPGMRVLDLGCGKGATSVFLAREYGVRVWAADLGVSPDDNAATFEAHGVGDQVTALKAEAHALPFARGFFDAIVCVDAYEYFGTADGYLAYLTSYLKPGGQLGIATPAMRREIRELGHIPPHIKACVGWEALAWHTAEWWRFQWEITELVTRHGRAAAGVRVARLAHVRAGLRGAQGLRRVSGGCDARGGSGRVPDVRAGDRAEGGIAAAGRRLP